MIPIFPSVIPIFPPGIPIYPCMFPIFPSSIPIFPSKIPIFPSRIHTLSKDCICMGIKARDCDCDCDCVPYTPLSSFPEPLLCIVPPLHWMDPPDFWAHDAKLYISKRHLVKLGWQSDSQSSKKLKGVLKPPTVLGMVLAGYSHALARFWWWKFQTGLGQLGKPAWILMIFQMPAWSRNPAAT